MSKIINLKRVRKARTRTQKEKTAEANRVEHGTPKHLRLTIEAERARAVRELEGHRRDDEA